MQGLKPSCFCFSQPHAIVSTASRSLRIAIMQLSTFSITFDFWRSGKKHSIDIA